MSIPKTEGYSCIVKIAEAALESDKEKAKKFMDRYITLYPISDLTFPFTHLLNGNKNPNGLKLLKTVKVCEHYYTEALGEEICIYCRKSRDENCNI